MMYDTHPDRLLPAYVNGSLDATATARIRQHLAICPPCRDTLAAWRALADAACFDAARQPAPRPDLLAEVQSRLDRDAERLTVSTWPRRFSTVIHPQKLVRPLAGLAAAAALVAGVALTPVGSSYAQGFLTIFTPQQFQAVPLTQADLRSLPDLVDYGTVTQPAHVKPIVVADLSAAEKASGLALLAPSVLPPGVQTPARFDVIPGENGAFTFSAAKAAATAKAKGKTLPPMPANIDGSSIQVTTGTAVVAIYHAANGNGASLPAAGAGAPKSAADLPALIIGQTTAPSIQSTGVSTAQLEQYLLAQPGISPRLSAAIQAIGDPTTTLPIPIPVNKAISHSVTVQGVQGLSVADQTGLGGGIIWEKNGTIYGVAGAFPESQLLAVANSLR